MSQTERIFHIDRAIREDGGITIHEIAGHFEISPRQAKRDIEYMRDRLEAPIVWSQERLRYEYSSTWESLRAADEKSLFAFAFLSSILTKYSYVPIVSEDIIAILREKIGGRYSGIADKVRYELPDLESIDGEVAYALCEALAGKSWLCIGYIDAKGGRSERSIVPARLLNYAGKWYCVALDSRSGELRTFSVARIDAGEKGSATQQALRDTLPESAKGGRPSLPSEAEIDRYVSSSYGIFKGEPIGLATLRFYGGAARAVRDQVWHRDQTLMPVSEARDDAQAIDLSLPVHDWTELLGRALRCGANCEVLSPSEFRARWIEEIGRMSALARIDDKAGP